MSSGIVMAFSSEAALLNAMDRLGAERVGPVETYTPASVRVGERHSSMPLIMLVAGLTGAAVGFGMQVYANTVSYPLDIGGRPEFSWPSFVPIAFEIGVLFAILTGVIGFFTISRMPKLYEPVDEAAGMRHAMQDQWIVAIRTEDENEQRRVREIARGLHPLTIGEIPS